MWRLPKKAKSCFYLSCAKVYTDQWAARIKEILFPGVAYRHTVLAIPDELRIYFYRNANLLSELMKVGMKCLEDTPTFYMWGYIVVIQSNGRSGIYNPHWT
ncbi:MAG: transposase zinc-binding domain-containing protein [Desulfobacteraceae bacterium]|nr:MAG: transposase zinc-binding domain-containing protein [Desulfobacteraceae bacterium]